jgi:hypothetical protein
MNQQPMFGNHAEQYRRAMNIGHLILSAWAMTIQLPMRRHCGKDFVGLTAFAGVLLIPVYVGFFNAPEIIYLLPVHVMFIVLHRASAWTRRLRGMVTHTFYEGDPWVARTLLFMKDERYCRSTSEPLLAVTAGLLLLPTAESAGFYFIIGGFAMAIVQQFADSQHQRRIDEINNGRIENDHLMRHVQQQQPSRRRRC